jgi:hypothetical protein
VKVIGLVPRGGVSRAECLALVGVTVDLGEPTQDDSIVAVLSAPSLGAFDGLASEAWVVEERPCWDRGGAGRPATGVKRISFLRRAGAITREDFSRAWADHVELARVHHPAFFRYTQNVVVEPAIAGSRELDGIAEITMRLRQDFVDRMYATPESRRIIGEDTQRFIDLTAGWRVSTREYSSTVDQGG